MRHSRPRRLTIAAITIAVALAASGPAIANPGAPPRVRTPEGAPIVADWLAEHRRYTDWHRTLVDPLFRASSTYAPGDLVPVSRAGIAGTGTIRRIVVADLAALDRAARAAGLRLRIVSAYRSYWSQHSVFQSWVQRSGYATAVRYSARAGHSEHQLGTTLDFSFVGGADPWDYADFASTRAGAWLKANAWRYGFVMSYPKAAEHLTGYGYEPWHYRYFGRSLAAEQRISGLVPRYWLWRRN